MFQLLQRISTKAGRTRDSRCSVALKLLSQRFPRKNTDFDENQGLSDLRADVLYRYLFSQIRHAVFELESNSQSSRRKTHATIAQHAQSYVSRRLLLHSEA